MTRLIAPPTPAEYADAYRYWEEQTTPRAVAEVADLIDARTTPVCAARARAEAVRRWHDTEQAQRARLATLRSAISRKDVA